VNLVASTQFSADADSTIIRLEAAKITTRINENPLLVLPMLNLRVGLQIKDFSYKTLD
jgi:hypothetical protein